MVSKANAVWEGGFKGGKGAMKPEHAPEAHFTVGSRFANDPHSSPEELIGAALAGCFSMALTLNLEIAGLSPKAVRTSAEVHLEKQAAGYAVAAIALTTSASVSGIDAARFGAIAEETKTSCPVSKALGGVDITLRASLEA